jgi:hypothetical protein
MTAQHVRKQHLLNETDEKKGIPVAIQDSINEKHSI